MIVSKSPALPAIRREHALAALARADGIEVVFVERPRDLRAARHDPLGWARELLVPHDRDGVVRGSIPVPGHRGAAALAVATRLGGRLLRRRVRPGDVVLAMTPWDWPAVASLGDVAGVRRVLDVADDWPGLLPQRAAFIRGLVERAGREADAVIVASPKLAAAFAPRAVLLVRNAAGDETLATPTVAPPGERRLLYVGTLSERVDEQLLEAVIDGDPAARIDLYGPCHYGAGPGPAPALAALLARFAGRLAWHGPVAREAVPALIDGADVGLLPFRPELARGDIMKVYDLLARGRPIAAAAGVVDDGLRPVPALHEGAGPDGFAAAVAAALDAPASERVAARTFAERNGWAARWPAWRAALLGTLRTVR